MADTAERLADVRVLIADGAELVRRGIRDVLAQDRRFAVVGEVERSVDLMDSCMELRPDIVLVGAGADVGDDAQSSLAALRHARRVAPVRAIVLVDAERVESLVDAVRAGAQGVLLRDSAGELLIQAMSDVLDGGAALDPRLIRNLFQSWQTAVGAALAGGEAQSPQLAPAILRALSPREQEVLRALAQGYRNKEIAVHLGVSVGTVKTHLRHIFRKLTVSDRTSAVLTALQARLPEAA
jgi:two-component system response regulator DegU